MVAVAALTLIGDLAVAGSPPVRTMRCRREPTPYWALTELRFLAVLLASVVASAAFAALEASVAS